MGGASTRSAADAPTFRVFSGTNQGGPKNDLLRDSISWDRAHIAWDALEPQRGVWNDTQLREFGERVLAYRKRGARLLPILGYNAPWSWYKSAREYSHGNTRCTVRPRDDGKFDLTVFERVSPVAAWRETKREIVEGNERWPLDSGKVRDGEITCAAS